MAQQTQQFLQNYLNNARKAHRHKTEDEPDDKSKASDTKNDDDWLTKKALEELKRDIAINKVKRKAFGSVTAPKSKTNKKFLSTTIRSVLSHNQRQENRHIAKSTDKLKELERYQRLKSSKKKFGDRKHEYKKPEKRKRRTSSTSSSSSDDNRKR